MQNMLDMLLEKKNSTSVCYESRIKKSAGSNKEKTILGKSYC
jgi:hypothetical protein